LARWTYVAGPRENTASHNRAVSWVWEYSGTSGESALVDVEVALSAWNSPGVSEEAAKAISSKGLAAITPYVNQSRLPRRLLVLRNGISVSEEGPD